MISFSMANGLVRYLLILLGTFPKNHCLTDCWLVDGQYRPDKYSEKLRLHLACFWSADNFPKCKQRMKIRKSGRQRMRKEANAAFKFTRASKSSK